MMDHFWGRSETFWVGVQALFAVAGFVVLFLYTVYTRRMMQLAEETRRSEIKPVFSVREWEYKQHMVYQPSELGGWEYPNAIGIDTFNGVFQVRNIGKGPAILLRAWHQPVSESFVLGGAEIFRPSSDVEMGRIDGMELLKDEMREARFDGFTGSRQWLFVVECGDIANGVNQLQILREPGEPAGTQWKMAHALGDRQGERIVSFFRRWIEVLAAIDKDSERLVP